MEDSQIMSPKMNAITSFSCLRVCKLLSIASYTLKKVHILILILCNVCQIANLYKLLLGIFKLIRSMLGS